MEQVEVALQPIERHEDRPAWPLLWARGEVAEELARQHARERQADSATRVVATALQQPFAMWSGIT